MDFYKLLLGNDRITGPGAALPTTMANGLIKVGAVITGPEKRNHLSATALILSILTYDICSIGFLPYLRSVLCKAYEVKGEMRNQVPLMYVSETK